MILEKFHFISRKEWIIFSFHFSLLEFSIYPLLQSSTSYNPAFLWQVPKNMCFGKISGEVEKRYNSNSLKRGIHLPFLFMFFSIVEFSTWLAQLPPARLYIFRLYFPICIFCISVFAFFIVVNFPVDWLWGLLQEFIVSARTSWCNHKLCSIVFPIKISYIYYIL